MMRFWHAVVFTFHLFMIPNKLNMTARQTNNPSREPFQEGS